MMLKLRRAMTGKPDGNVPCNMVYVEDLKAWLRGKRVSVSQMATAGAAAHHNALIGELLQEIEDAEKEGA